MRISLVMIGSGAGGVQQTILPYSDALLNAGHELQVVLYRKSPMIPEVRALGIQPEFVTFPCQNKVLTRLFRWELQRKLKTFKPDIIIGFAGRGYPEARRAMGREVPIVTRVASLKSKAISKLTGADGYLVTSLFMKELIEETGVAPSAVKVVPNFLRHPLALVERQEFRTPPVIGSLGRLMKDKGFDVLLDALHILRKDGSDFRAKIGGDGEDMAALQEQAGRLGLADIVEFSGWIGNDRKAAFLGELDIFVCPSRYEPFGIVMLEAMEAGLPLVASETTGSAEIIDDGQTGLRVPNEDPVAMAQALRKLIDSPENARNMANAAARHLKERFHISSAGQVLAANVVDLQAAFTQQKSKANDI